MTGSTVTAPLQGAGLGLRRALLGPLSASCPSAVDFLEVAPENWIPLGGALGRRFRELAERFPFVAHGLSLSLGGPAPLDMELVAAVRRFLDEHRFRGYTEHLSYCSDHGHLYDLMPMPFTQEAVRHVAARIRQVQDALERRIGIEHVSYYAVPLRDMSEIEFVTAVLAEADCDLLLDVNNVWVNAVNHGYDPCDFIDALPKERIVYVHVAGHYDEAPDLKIDSHGSEVIDPVWDLLAFAYRRFGVLPTLLERDFNIPPLGELLREVGHIRALQHRAGAGSGREAGA